MVLKRETERLTGRLSVGYQSIVLRLFDCGPSVVHYGSFFGRFLVDYDRLWSITGRFSVDSFPIIGGTSVDYESILGR